VQLIFFFTTPSGGFSDSVTNPFFFTALLGGCSDGAINFFLQLCQRVAAKVQLTFFFTTPSGGCSDGATNLFFFHNSVGGLLQWCNHFCFFTTPLGGCSNDATIFVFSQLHWGFAPMTQLIFFHNCQGMSFDGPINYMHTVTHYKFCTT